MSRRATASIVASPVLIGAVTLLVIVVTVFLAYNANSGLPFVPTYNVAAELPSGSNMVVGNEVRVGGFRVGVIQRIRSGTKGEGELNRAIAVADLRLDKTVEPLAEDTRMIVRPRSALGLKYLEITPGSSPRQLKAGSVIPLENAKRPVEFDDFLNTFDEGLREDSTTALEGYGNAFGGRGQSINAAIAELPEFFRALEPVMRTLSDPDTGLAGFFRNGARLTREVAPVAEVQADLFANMNDTFEAISRDPEALRQTIEKQPELFDAGRTSFPIQRKFLRNFTDLTRRLRPGVRVLPEELPKLVDAFRVGQDVLPDTVALNRRTEDVFRALDDLVSDPNTLLALRDLRDTTETAGPLIRHLAPYQLVCNYWNYWWTGYGDHQSQGFQDGNVQRILAKNGDPTQDNDLGNAKADRPADVPAGQDPSTAFAPSGRAKQKLNAQAYSPAIDAQGNADCQTGQTGYPDGPLASRNRYGTREDGGQHVVLDGNTPGLAGNSTGPENGGGRRGEIPLPRNLRRVR